MWIRSARQPDGKFHVAVKDFDGLDWASGAFTTMVEADEFGQRSERCMTMNMLDPYRESIAISDDELLRELMG